LLEEPWVDDLTSDSVFSGNLFTLLQHGCKVFDMTYSDHDDSWTFHAVDDLNHMRAVKIILDSGADGSALPLAYARAGVATTSDEKLRFVDAQGCALNISSTRLATVDFGGFSLKEEFIVASITSPLLSLGKLMKHGWSLQKIGR
jgi:hypothetical protein